MGKKVTKAQLQKQLEEANKTKDNLWKVIEKKDEELSQLRHVLSQANDNVRDLTATNTELEARLENAKRDHRAEVTKLREKLDETSGEYLEAARAHGKTLTSLDYLAQDIIDLLGDKFKVLITDVIEEVEAKKAQARADAALREEQEKLAEEWAKQIEAEAVRKVDGDKPEKVKPDEAKTTQMAAPDTGED